MVYIFKDYKEYDQFIKGGSIYKEPERVEPPKEAVDEVQVKPAHKRKSKGDAKSVGKSAKNAD